MFAGERARLSVFSYVLAYHSQISELEFARLARVQRFSCFVHVYIEHIFYDCFFVHELPES